MRKPILITAAILSLLVGLTFMMKKGSNEKSPETTQSVNDPHQAEAPSVAVNSEPSKVTPATPPTETQNPSAPTVTAPTGNTAGTQTALPTGGNTAVPAITPFTAEDERCHSIEYRPTAAAKGRDLEEFLDQTNAFPILHANVNTKTVCLKINDQPVAFRLQKHKGQWEAVVGGIVGPESKIHLSYCSGKAKCKEDCKIPQKRFMDEAIDGAGGDETLFGSWGPENDAETRKQLMARNQELRSVASENQALNDQAMMRDWKIEPGKDRACKE
jgi:hypothetical protein